MTIALAPLINNQSVDMDSVLCGLLDDENASEVTTVCSLDGRSLYLSAAVGPKLGWAPRPAD